MILKMQRSGVKLSRRVTPLTWLSRSPPTKSPPTKSLPTKYTELENGLGFYSGTRTTENRYTLLTNYIGDEGNVHP